MKMNKKGASSILFIIIITIAMLAANQFLDISQRLYALHEIQGVMDMAGIQALRSSVNEEKWLKDEVLEINQTRAKNEFRATTLNTIQNNLSNSVKVPRIISINIYAPNSPGLDKLGIPGGESREQYYIESVLTFEMNKNVARLINTGQLSRFYSFFYGEKLEIWADSSNSNRDIYAVRTVSRLVLR